MVVLHVKSFLNSIDTISKVFLLSPYGKVSKDDNLPSRSTCTISNISTLVGFTSYFLFHLIYVTDAGNDENINRTKIVTLVIDFYNKYSGCIVFAIFIGCGYFHQSKTAKIHSTFIEIEKIAKQQLKVGIENVITLRTVYFQALLMFTAVSVTEWNNCLMYIGPVSGFTNYCLLLCFIPQLVTVAVEFRIFAYFLLIKARYELINTLIHDYRSNIDKFNRSFTTSNAATLPPFTIICGDTYFYINDYMRPRKIIKVEKSSAARKFLVNIKHQITRLKTIMRSLLNFKISHDYHDNRLGENVINYNFNYIDRIMAMQTIYTKLHEIFDLISEAYGMQIIAIIAVQFITLTTLMYDFSMNIVRLLSTNISTSETDLAIEEMCNSGLWIVIFMYKVYSICYILHVTIEEGQKIGSFIHVFGLHTSNLDERFKIKMFLLRILHHKIKFAPFGLFEIDLKLFSMIFGAITTYILILIQFDLAQKD